MLGFFALGCWPACGVSAFRRAEELPIEYRSLLIDKLQVPTSNLLYVSESNPFEAYRQLLGPMERYRTSLRKLGGCRLAV